MGRRSATSDYETWDFRIDDWDHHYFFSNYRIRLGGKEAGFDESSQFTLDCIVTYPDARKGTAAQLSFIPDRRIDDLLIDDASSSPPAIGNLSTRKNDFRAYITIPWQSHAHILQMLSAGTFKYVQLHGRRIPRSGINIDMVMFARKDPDPDEIESTENIQAISL